jgi:hypothetical protein
MFNIKLTFWKSASNRSIASLIVVIELLSWCSESGRWNVKIGFTTSSRRGPILTANAKDLIVVHQVCSTCTDAVSPDTYCTCSLTSAFPSDIYILAFPPNSPSSSLGAAVTSPSGGTRSQQDFQPPRFRVKILPDVTSSTG